MSAVGMILVLLLAGCGLNQKTEEQDGQAEEKTKISIAWWGLENRRQIMEELIQIYEEEHTDIEFEMIPMGWEWYFDWLSMQAASGSMPDIVQMDYMYLSTYTRNGSLADLQEFVENGIIDTSYIDKRYVDAGREGDKIAGMALGITTLAVGYNPELFDMAGIKEPDSDWTWEDYIHMNRKITEATGKKSAVVAVGVTGDINLLHYWVRQHGACLFNEEGNGLGFADDSILVEYFNMWKSMMDEGISPNPDEMAEILTHGQEADPVVTGSAGTIFEWGNYAAKMAEFNDSLKIVTPPLGKDSGQKGLWMKPSMFFSVAKNSKVKEACAEFINWFLNSEEANDILKGERGMPVSSKIRENLRSSGKLTMQQESMFDYHEEAERLSGELPAPDPIGISAVNEAFEAIGNAVFYEQMTAEEGAQKFRKRVAGILGGETAP
jgi:ABC-type sugar transport system, periplasmic component